MSWKQLRSKRGSSDTCWPIWHLICTLSTPSNRLRVSRLFLHNQTTFPGLQMPTRLYTFQPRHSRIRLITEYLLRNGLAWVFHPSPTPCSMPVRWHLTNHRGQRVGPKVMSWTRFLMQTCLLGQHQLRWHSPTLVVREGQTEVSCKQKHKENERR